jgi:hypothetical protein
VQDGAQPAGIASLDTGPQGAYHQAMTSNLRFTRHALRGSALARAAALALGLLLLASAFPGPARAQEPSTTFAKAPPLPDMAGKVVLVTGSTDGLGRDVARRFAAAGAHVLVTGRSVERGEALVAEIAKRGTGSARFYRADLASLDEVRALAAAVARDNQRLDVLINNAGVGFIFDSTRKFSAEGDRGGAVVRVRGYQRRHAPARADTRPGTDGAMGAARGPAPAGAGCLDQGHAPDHRRWRQ